MRLRVVLTGGADLPPGAEPAALVAGTYPAVLGGHDLVAFIAATEKLTSRVP